MELVIVLVEAWVRMRVLGWENEWVKVRVLG
jgi:hypothetical protein